MIKKIIFICLFIIMLQAVQAARPVFEIIIEDHLFYPAEITIPAGTKVRLIIKNQDITPEQFDSFDLNREKVIFPGRESSVYIGPLSEGSYQFFGEYHPSSAVGTVIVVEQKHAD